MTKIPKTQTWWRWLKRGLFTVAVLITLAALAVVFENWRGRRAWANYRAELEAKGEVLDWRKLVPQNVPDDQNFAKAPFVSAVFEHARNPTSKEGELADPQTRERVASMFGWIQRMKGLGNWRKAKLTDWAEVRAELRLRTNSPSPQVRKLLEHQPGTPLGDLQFLFSLNKREMNQIRAAATRPLSSFNVHYGESFPSLVPELQAVRTLGRGFLLEPRVALASGDVESALADWQTALRIGRAVDGDPVLICMMVKLAVTDGTLETIWEGLATHRWNEKHLIVIQETLNRINLVKDAMAAFRGEMTLSLAGVDQLFISATEAGGTHLIPRLLIPAVSARSKIDIVRLYEDYTFPTLDPGNEFVDIALSKTNDTRVKTEWDRAGFYHLYARLLQPAIYKTVAKLANGQTAIHLAIVACALERYRLAEGKYPDALDGLVPRFLDNIPLDLDKKALRYEPQPDGSFILYSIGVDLKDDHGRIGKADGTFTTDEGDWVWKYPKTSQ